MSRLSVITIGIERTLLALAVLLVLAIHLGGRLTPGWFHTYFPFAEAIWQLLPAAQIVLITMWLCVGISPLWLRFSTWPMLLALWAYAWGDSLSSHTAATWLLLTGAIAGGVMVIGRCCGVKLALARSATTGIDNGSRHPQFSLRALIVLTTLIGVTLGVLEMLRPSLRTPPELSTELELVLLARVESNSVMEFFAGATLRSAVLASSLATVALAAIVCVLRPGPMWLRLVVTAILVPLLGIYLANLTGNELAVGISLAMSLSVLAAIVGISVWPLRLLGVRLVRRTGFQPVLSKLFQDRLKTCPTEKDHEPRASVA